jgi:ATP-dependent Clp protease ATP-binding subunit ClpX
MDAMFEVPSHKVETFVITLDYAKEQMNKANLSRLQMA